MTRLEKLALSAAAVAAAFNVFLFTAGFTLADATGGALYWLRLVVAGATACAYDLILVATVLGVRNGHRNRWSYLTAVAAALISLLVGLDVAGVWSQPWLHATYSVVVLMFMLHLTADSKVQPEAEAQPFVTVEVHNQVAAVAMQPEAQPAHPPRQLPATAKAITIDGITYPSATAAATALNISRQAATKRATRQMEGVA